MPVVRIDPTAPDAQILDRAAHLLRDGRLVAFPTETVYGLGANALDPEAIARIYAAKGRPSYNPLIVHVANVAGARRVASDWPERAEALARAFWPGPLTIVLPKREEIPDALTAGLSSIAVRAPSHPVALALIAAAGIPIAAPSANRSMMLSPTTAQHVAASLGDRVDLILDGGPTTVGIESTVVDLTSTRAMILRPGMISTPELERVIGPVESAASVGGDAARKSPGMLDRHYAPRARLVVVDADRVAGALNEEGARGANVEALSISAAVGRRMPRDASAYAATLYAALHELDQAGIEVIIVERVPAGPDWEGVRDRLTRAAFDRV